MAAAILENGMVKIIPSGGRFADRELIQKLISQTASWGNIEKIFCLQNTVAGIRRNGTVAIAGRRTEEAERELYQWSEISSIAVSPGGGQMLGLRKNGRVEGTGILKEQIREWRDILAVKLYQQAGGGKETLCAAGVRKNGDLIYSICVISYNSRRKEDKRPLFPESRASAAIGHAAKRTDKMEDALEHTKDIFGKLPFCSLKIPGCPHQAFYVLSLFHQQTGRAENRKSG